MASHHACRVITLLHHPLVCLLLLRCVYSISAFTTTEWSQRCNPIRPTVVDVPQHCSKMFMVKNAAMHDSKAYWLDEFKAPTGEILNPYKVLKVNRDATIVQIKNAYREQSRRYHPDTQRYKSVLPGSW